MNIVLSEWHESTNCAWCERSKECVTADFGDGFITKSDLCWKCLQQALRVHAKQNTTKYNPPTTGQRSNS